jgi:hypothetical protein
MYWGLALHQQAAKAVDRKYTKNYFRKFTIGFCCSSFGETSYIR